MNEELEDATQIVELHQKLVKHMDGYNAYICLRAVCAIIGTIIVDYGEDMSTKRKTKEVFDMIKLSVKCRQLLNMMVEQGNTNLH